MGGKSDAPAPPDYTSAANATAAGNREAALAGTEANRVNQYTPNGNLTYAQTGTSASGNPLWSSYQTLSPEQADIQAKNNALSQSLLGTAGTGLNQVHTLLSGNNTALDESKLAQPSIQGQAVQDAIMSRLRPEMEREQKGLDNQLANQGIMQGSEAWGTAQDKQTQGKNDLYTQAALQGIQTGNAARQQGIGEQYSTQTRPLDIVNALRTGNQVSNPAWAPVPQQTPYQGPDLLGAAQGNYNAQMGQYNAQQAQQNALTGGLFSLGSAALGRA